MKKYLLLTSVVLVSAAVGGAYAAVDCSTPPSCSELGYDMTASECGSAAKLKCPFGDGYYCAPKKEESGEADDSPVESSCGNGMIIYDNRKCYNGFPKDRVPMGIIVDATTSLAAALDEYNPQSPGNIRYERWGLPGGDTGVGNCVYNTTNGYNEIGGEGMGCTTIGTITGYCTTTSCEKLGYCNTYHPWFDQVSDSRYASDVIQKCYGTVNFADINSDTFLPSAKEVQKMSQIASKFNQVIIPDIKEHYNVLVDEINIDSYYWTSNEVDANNALAVNPGRGPEKKWKEEKYQYRCFFYYDKELSSSDYKTMCGFP